MKRLFPIVFLLIAAYAWSDNPIPTPTKERQEKQYAAAQADRKSDVEQKQTQPASIINVINIPSKPSNEHAEGNPKNVDNSSFCKEAIDILSVLFTTIATVVIAIFTVCLSKSTRKLWVEAKDAGITAKKSADAAFLNAQAVINSERPWFVVNVDNGPDLFKFGCLNQGRTPGEIISISVNIERISDLENASLSYSGSVMMPSLNFIVPRDSFPIGYGIDTATQILQHPDADAIANSSLFLVYYGKIIYRDVLHPVDMSGGIHETRWCFVWQPSSQSFIRSGPNGGNGYT